MGRARIVLAGTCPKLQGLRWESEKNLRIGRQENLDIVLPDISVNRLHAEVLTNGQKWAVRDLVNQERFLTLVNSTPVGRGLPTLRQGDVLQFGNLTLKVAELSVEPAAPPPQAPESADSDLPFIKTSGAVLKVQATTQHSWDEALQTVAFDKEQRPVQGQHMLTLLRTGYHLCHLSCLDELLHSILEDVVRALGAQRGVLVLAEPDGSLRPRAVLGPGLPPAREACYSRTLTARCFQQGESMLCRDVAADAALLRAGSVMRGSMSSIICALLRSPRKRLGVLHLDRGPIQEPFAPADFYLADAIAANVAVGIESAQLVEQQREEFVQTVTTLARAVELRDQYTGDHTRRVTDYALLLADELRLSPRERYHIQSGTPLHDIGKIGIDDAVLRKPGKLTTAEFEYMKTHTVKGAVILQTIANLSPMIPIVRHHHERWDGTGYPDGLAFEQISTTARIVAVADAFDAMTSTRPYRPALPAEAAFREIATKAGSHFDPHCAEAFLRLRPRVEALLTSS